MVFGATVTLTVPSPEPLGLPEIVSHVSSLVAVQSQPAGAVTVTFVLLPSGGTDTEGGVTAKLQTTPLWVKVTVSPATVSVAVRDNAVVFGATVTLTVPSPEPLGLPEIVSHVSSLVAVQSQPAGAVTVTFVLLPSGGTDTEGGVTAKLQTTPLWVKVTVSPATVSVAVRDNAVVFGATVAFTVPSPEPLGLSVIVSHVASLVAVQSQAAGAVTVTPALLPSGGTDTEDGATAKLQTTPLWVKVTVSPATVSVAVRDNAVVFGATVALTVPSPEPLGLPVIVSQSALLVAVQLHSAGAVTLTVLLPPSLANRSVWAATEKVHDGDGSGRGVGSVPDWQALNAHATKRSRTPRIVCLRYTHGHSQPKTPPVSNA